MANATEEPSRAARPLAGIDRDPSRRNLDADDPDERPGAAQPASHGQVSAQVALDVRRGLCSSPKWLPPYLFYDARGSELYEQITELPEYYPTRTEREILRENARALVALAAGDSVRPLHVIELGAGSASKTRLVLEAVVAHQGHALYLPVDVSSSALDDARARIERELPSVSVRPFVGRHEEAFPAIARLGPRRLVLFIGSSIGNLEDADAVALLSGLRRSLGQDGRLLLGTDLRKSPSVLLPAYADARGVTASFNKNVLSRLNRELGADFDLDDFRHVARWNDGASRVEMHLESLRAHTVHIATLGLSVCFARGETIHTESSIKYDMPRVDALLDAAGFSRMRSFTDPARAFAVHLAEVTPRCTARRQPQSPTLPAPGVPKFCT